MKKKKKLEEEDKAKRHRKANKSQVWNTTIFFVFKIAKKIDESDMGEPHHLYNWEQLSATMTKQEKILLNNLQDVLIKKNHFAKATEEMEPGPETNLLVKNEGARFIRAFLEYLLLSL